MESKIVENGSKKRKEFDKDELSSYKKFKINDICVFSIGNEQEFMKGLMNNLYLHIFVNCIDENEMEQYFYNYVPKKLNIYILIQQFADTINQTYRSFFKKMVGLKNEELRTGKSLDNSKTKLKYTNKDKIITITNNFFESLRGSFQNKVDGVNYNIKRLITIIATKYIVSFTSDKVKKLISDELMKQINKKFPDK